MKNFWIQMIAIVAIFFWVISIQQKKQYKILLWQTISNLVYTIQYFLLGVYTASAMNLISTVRCFLFYKQKKERKKIKESWLIGFILLLIIFGILTYDGYLSLIPVIITIFYTISSYMKDAKWIRIVILIAAFIWIYYNYVVGAYICVIGNVFEIISGTLAVIRFSNVKE